MPEDEPAASLAAQIRVRFTKSKNALMDNQDYLLAAENFCNEGDIRHTLKQFHDHTTSQTFSHALGGLLLQAAQNMVAKLKAVNLMESYWRRTSPIVAIFESAVYIWSMLSFDVREIVKCEFDEDREAVVGAMLGGFSVATKMMKNKWSGFSPEVYSLSRLFFYPNDSIKAAECFFRVLLASEGRILPLSSAEINKDVDRELGDAERVLLSLLNNFYDQIKSELGGTVTGLVSFYLDNRSD